jgi:CRISPR-associated protein Cmr4
VSHFGIVGDDMLTWLMTTTTETRARIRIDGDRKIVSDGQFWFEEAIPADSVFYLPLREPEFGRTLLAAIDPAPGAMFRVVEESLHKPLQIGGNISIGNGLIRAHLDRSGQGVPA